MGVGGEGVEVEFPIKVIPKVRRKGSLFDEHVKCEVLGTRQTEKNLKLSLFLCSLIQPVFNSMRISSN